ncbi:MAG: heparinase II/III family protein [Pirellulales bacterium]
MNLLRLLHTIRHLRPVQLYGRVWQQLTRPRADRRPAPPVRPQPEPWTRPAEHPPTMLGPATFRFLSETRDLAWPGGWNDPDIHKLWLFNLHYFADLAAVDCDARRAWHEALISRWIQDNPPFAGHAWVPYCVSQRIIHWVKWLLAGNDPAAGMLDSLAMQARYLERRLEYHVQGNHLLANATALAFTGVYFNGKEGDRWLATALSLLRAQVDEQILRDGGHFELSPMYHALVLEHLLDVTNLARAYSGTVPEVATLADSWHARIAAMLGWLRTMTFPDGQIAVVSDSAWEIAATTAQLAAYADRLGYASPPLSPQPCLHLSDSGYLRLQRGPAVLIADVGPIGASYQAGHGHADVLSFELALGEQRVVVDTGTSVYYGNPRARLLERGTPAHNTITVDGADSSEVWDNFRVARRAHPRRLAIENASASTDDTVLVVSCAHDGYRRLPGRVEHHRTWRLTGDRLQIDDRLDGQFQSAVARFHLDPAARIVALGDDELAEQIEEVGKSLPGNCRVILPGWSVVLETSGCRLRLERSTYHPRFGTSLDNLCIAAELTGPQASFCWSWSPCES